MNTTSLVLALSTANASKRINPSAVLYGLQTTLCEAKHMQTTGEERKTRGMILDDARAEMLCRIYPHVLVVVLFGT